MADDSCPQCGVQYRNGVTCEDAFNQMLALEFADEAFGRVHFLTVACYMIQHGFYSSSALDWIGERLQEYLQEQLPVSRIRQQAAHRVDDALREWKVLRQPNDPVQSKIAWSMTIQDVVNDYQNAAEYVDQVQGWAARTLDEMQPLLKKGNG